MNKNILQEITDKKTLLCTDLNFTSVYSLLSTYNLLNGSTNTNKLVKLYIPDNSKIVSATETQIILNSKLIFEVQQEIPAPPALPPAPILLQTTVDLILNISSLVLDFPVSSLIDRNVKVSSSSTVNMLSSNSSTISLASNSVFNLNLVLEKDLELESFLDSFISSLNTANPKTITRFECPTNNDFFLKYDEFTDIMIGYKDTYKDNTDINTAIGLLNEFLLIDLSTMFSKNILESYYNNYISKINLIYSTIDAWVAYFDRLKKLMSKIKIADAFVAEEECQNMYNAKPLESQTDIDELVNIYDTTGQDEYVQRKQELLFQIKID